MTGGVDAPTSSKLGATKSFKTRFWTWLTRFVCESLEDDSRSSLSAWQRAGNISLSPPLSHSLTLSLSHSLTHSLTLSLSRSLTLSRMMGVGGGAGGCALLLEILQIDTLMEF